MTVAAALIAAPSVAVLIAAPAASADVPSSDSAAGPPYIDHVSWARYSGLSSLRLFPTAAGRALAGDIGKTAAQADEAWREVLALAPNADTAGMRAQFVCHWNFAEFAEPGKVSWDLEPWRPVVGPNAMVLAGCNPGGGR